MYDMYIDSIIGMLLNVPEKSKDGVNARSDLVNMGIRSELRPIMKEKHTYLPPATHTFSGMEKVSFCVFLHGVKALKGYSSNRYTLHGAC